MHCLCNLKYITHSEKKHPQQQKCVDSIGCITKTAGLFVIIKWTPCCKSCRSRAKAEDLARSSASSLDDPGTEGLLKHAAIQMAPKIRRLVWVFYDV